MSGLSIVTTEKLIFSCIFSDVSLMTNLDKNYFVSQLGQDLFNTITELTNKKMDIKNINHVVALGNKKNSEITHDLLEKIEIDFELNNFDLYLIELKKEYAKKNLQGFILNDLKLETFKKSSFDIDKIKELQELISENINIIEDNNNNKNVKSICELYTGFVEHLKTRASGENKYEMGEYYFDSHFRCGLLPSEQITFYSSSGIGKTTLKLHYINCRINKKLPTLDINLELSETSYAQRLLSSRLNLDSKVFYPDMDGDFDDSIFQRIEEEKIKLEHSSYYQYVRENEMDINSKLKKVIREFKEKTGHDYVVVFLDVTDLLMDFNVSAKGENTAESYKRACGRLKNLAFEENCHFVNIVHANRDFDNVKINSIDDLSKIVPSISSIRNSSAFEKDSRGVFSIMRKKFYAERMFANDPKLLLMDDIMELQLQKSNETELFTLKYLFDGSRSKITKYIEEDSNNDTD